jgi:hypothetical protein
LVDRLAVTAADTQRGEQQADQKQKENEKSTYPTIAHLTGAAPSSAEIGH